MRSWSDINCTQIKMDLAPAVGSVIHSYAAPEEDLSGVKSNASLSHPNSYHIWGGGKQSSCIVLHHAHLCVSFFFILFFSKHLITSGRFEHIRKIKVIWSCLVEWITSWTSLLGSKFKFIPHQCLIPHKI